MTLLTDMTPPLACRRTLSRASRDLIQTCTHNDGPWHVGNMKGVGRSCQQTFVDTYVCEHGKA